MNQIFTELFVCLFVFLAVKSHIFMPRRHGSKYKNMDLLDISAVKLLIQQFLYGNPFFSSEEMCSQQLLKICVFFWN